MRGLRLPALSATTVRALRAGALALFVVLPTRALAAPPRQGNPPAAPTPGQPTPAQPSPVPSAPAPPPAPASTVSGLEEIVVAAPEPRYVAPTRRDRIGRIWAPVMINDQGPFRLVLDTGANHSAVNESVARALGLTPDRAQSVTLQGVTGSRVVPSIAIDSLVLGDLELRLKRLPIVVDALGGAEGVLGTDGLEDKRITIDFRHDRITVFRSHRERAPAGFVTVPVDLAGGLLLLAHVTVGGVKARAIIDTGGQVTLANTALETALRQRTRAEDRNTDSIEGATLDIEYGDRLVLPPIRVGPLSIAGARISAGDMQIFKHWNLTDTPAILIGMDVIGLLDTLIIDYPRRELQVLTH